MAPTWYIAGNERPLGPINPPPPANRGYTFQGSATTTVNSDTATFSINLGNATPDRYIVIGVTLQGIGISLVSLTANGVTLNQDSSNTNAFLCSGLVTSGSGTQNIVLTTTNEAFAERNIFVWRLFGLTFNSVKNTANGSGNTTNMILSVASGDFLFATSEGTNNTETFPNSTQAPAEVLTSATTGVAADWTIAASNASFKIGSTAGTKAEVAASYT